MRIPCIVLNGKNAVVVVVRARREWQHTKITLNLHVDKPPI